MFKKGQRITYEGRTGVLGKKSTQFGKPGFCVKWDNGWTETIVTVERLTEEMSKVAISALSGENANSDEATQPDRAKCDDSKKSDKWYTPPQIVDLVTQVLGAIDLDPCADDGKHVTAAQHYTAADDGLSKPWHGRVFMNPPYSCPGKWVAKLQSEIEAGRVTEAIALVPAATDTNWLSPLLDSQPICFWKGRIKFLDTNYQPKQSARQSHCLIYWGANQQKFKQVFQEFGVVKNAELQPVTKANAKPGTYIIDQYKSLGIISINLGFGFVVDWLGIGEVANPPSGKAITYNWERDDDAISRLAIAPESLIPQAEMNAQVEILPPNSSLKKDFSGQSGEVLKTMHLVYLPEEDTTVQFDNDEIQFVNEGHKIMTTFQFSETARISEQIAQLQKQLDQLTASLQPYRECEQKAEELRLQVAEYVHEMTAKGIPQNDILTWAKSLYSAASCTDFVIGDSGAIAAQNQVIAELKTELASAKKRLDQALVDRMEATALLENTTAQRDKALARITSMTAGQLRVAQKLKSLRDERQQMIEGNACLLQRIQELEQELANFQAQTDTATIEILQKENAYLITKIQKLEAIQSEKMGGGSQFPEHIEAFSKLNEKELLTSDIQQAYIKILSKDDIVQTPDGEVGTVTGFAYGNVIVKLVNGEFNFRRDQLKWISKKAQAPQLHNFQEGDRVEVVDIPDNDSLQYLLHNQGTVVGVKGNSVAVLIDATDDEGQHEVVLSTFYLKLLEVKHPDIEAQTRGREFIESIRSKAGINNITWTNISKVCQGNSLVLGEMSLAAKTKYQKELIEKLPTLMADYISETGDITDFDWVGKTFKSKVEALLEAKKSLGYHSNDWVRVVETGEVWQVRSFDGEWLSVKQDNKIASLHKSEVELIKSEDVRVA
jgi:phage N-6-adenine-methyltransferase